MSGAHNSFVPGLSFRIHSGISVYTWPQCFHTCKSCEQRMAMCPCGARPVANTYHVSPAFMIEGSCVPQKSPESSKTCGARCAASSAEHQPIARIAPRENVGSILAYE